MKLLKALLRTTKTTQARSLAVAALPLSSQTRGPASFSRRSSWSRMTPDCTLGQHAARAAGFRTGETSVGSNGKTASTWHSPENTYVETHALSIRVCLPHCTCAVCTTNARARQDVHRPSAVVAAALSQLADRRSTQAHRNVTALAHTHAPSPSERPRLAPPCANRHSALRAFGHRALNPYARSGRVILEGACMRRAPQFPERKVGPVWGEAATLP